VEQLIFVGIILFFSVLEAIARRGRERRGAEPPAPEDWPAPGEPRRVPEVRPRPESARPTPTGGLPTYDDEPSFDERILDETPRPQARPESQGSEGMVPADVWEEILALARGGGPPQAPRPAQRPAPPAPPRPPAPGPRAPTPRARRPTVPPSKAKPAGERAEPVHPVHLTHPKMGTPVKDRLTAPAAPPSRSVSRDARAALDAISAGHASLRRAVLLAEVLGPPAALRGDPYESL